MSTLYGDQHRALQAQFETGPLADRVAAFIVSPVLPPEAQGFIATRDLFFLTTIDHRGFPTVSHKGGPVGFVQVVDERTLRFPSFDGNGMYLSLGNLTAQPKVGLLFIDFEVPHRVRVHGTARLITDPALVAACPGAECLVEVTVEETFINCPRYIHRYQRLAASPYVPAEGCPAPAPQWKRIDALQDVLPARDQGVAAAAGGTLTPEEYGARVLRGEG